MTGEVSADVGARAVSASTGTRATAGGTSSNPVAGLLSARTAESIAARDPRLLETIARSVGAVLARDPSAASINVRAVAAQIAQEILDQYIVDRVLSCEPGSQRNRVHVRQFWNAGYLDVAGDSTTYWTSEATDLEIARGEIIGQEMSGSGWIDLELDGELDVVVPEVGLTITFTLQTSPIPYAAPEVWTTIATWTLGADPTLATLPRKFSTTARIRAHGNSGATQKHTITTETFATPITALPVSPRLVPLNGDLLTPWDTRWSTALRLLCKIDGVPSVARRATVFGSSALLYPRDPDGY